MTDDATPPADPAVPPTDPDPALATPPADPIDATGEPKPLLRTAPEAPAEPTPFDPETFKFPEAEGLSFSDDDKSFLAKIASDYKVPEQAMTALLDRYVKSVQTAVDGQGTQRDTAWNQLIADNVKQITEHYGDKLDATVTKLEGVIDTYGGDDFREFLAITGGHSHPAVFSFLEKVASAVGEAKPVVPGGTAVAPTGLAARYPSMVTKE